MAALLEGLSAGSAYCVSLLHFYVKKLPLRVSISLATLL
jgi:hypothetical protein